ncbi:MAG: hypothetical protein E7660_04455 [Ruminococcaceae bacterium]|nr:hypothetical protein [Oscillospiraceae bacterium]
MKYTPTPKNKKAVVSGVILMITAFLLFAFAGSGLTRQVAILQLISVAILALASFLMIKSITVYTYLIIPVDEEDGTDYSAVSVPFPPNKLTFTVSKRFGKGKESYLCQLDMASLKSVTKLSGNADEDKKTIAKHGKMAIYKYLATLGPTETVLLVFNKRGYDKTALIIEPDNAMFQYLRTVADINKNAPMDDDE